MNLKEIREMLAKYPAGTIHRGGTFVYCNHEIVKLDSLGRKTKYRVRCGKRRLTLTAIQRHVQKAHSS
jgi:hypothetical protein